MSDIVEQLRYWHSKTTSTLYVEAAEEIDRLRAEVERQVDLTCRFELDLQAERALADRLAEALRSAESALRSYPMQAFRTDRVQRERARGIDAAQDALAAYDEARR